MKRIKERLKENRFLYQMMGGTLFITSVSLFLFTLFFSWFSTEAMRSEIVAGKQNELSRVASIVNFRAEYASFIMQSATRDKDISSLFYDDNSASILPGLRALSELRQSVRHLYSIYIFNQDSQQIYSTSATQTYAIRGLDQFEDPGFLDILDHIGSYPKFSPILRLISHESPNGLRHEEYVYTYLLYDAYVSSGVSNIMAFNFHLSWMEDALRYISPDPGGDTVWIIDKNRQIVYSDQGALISTIGSERQFPESIFLQPSGSLIVDTEKGEKHILVFSSPERSGYEKWTFVSEGNYSEMIRPITRLRRIVAVITALVLLGSLGGVFIFSQRMYKPVRLVINDVEKLKLEQEKKQAMERDMYLRKLFHGDITEEPSKIIEKCRELGVSYPWAQDHRVMLLSIDYFRSYALRYRDQIEETDQRIEKIIEKEIAQNYSQYILLKTDDKWCACVPGEEAVRTARVKGIFDAINQELSQQLNLSLSISVSVLGHSVGDVSYLYANAEENLSYRFLLGHQQILTADNTKDYGSEQFSYPHEAEEKLIFNLKSGKREKAELCYEQFLDQLRLFPVSSIRLSFVLLADAIKRSFSNSITEISSVLLKIDQFHRRLNELETLEEVNQLFLHLFWEITEKVKERASQKYDQMIQQVKDYVKLHYSDISLSMNEVADHVDISTTYLSRLFKQTTGMSFSDFLASFRLEVACDLILHTDKTFTEISELAGFTNCSYFYIVFKKHMNCTPNQYRKQFGNITGDKNETMENSGEEKPQDESASLAD